MPDKDNNFGFSLVLDFRKPKNSFTIACALNTKAQVICARSKKNISVFL